MSEKQIIDKLNNIQKEQEIGGALSNASFGLAVSAVGISGVQNTTRWEVITLCVFLICIGLAGFIWNIIKWRLAQRR